MWRKLQNHFNPKRFFPFSMITELRFNCAVSETFCELRQMFSDVVLSFTLATPKTVNGLYYCCFVGSESV